LSVRQILSTDGSEFLSETKTKLRSRQVDLPDEVVTALRKHKNITNQEKLAGGHEYIDLGLVVCTSNGNKVIPRNLYRTFKRLVKASDLPSIRFHDLRHTHATVLISNGVHVKQV